MVQDGRSINHITFTCPQVFCVSDASEFGIGGFNSEGFAWRWEIPPTQRGFFSLNMLEFLASYLTIRMTLKQIVTTDIKHQGIKIQALTDSSCALSWILKGGADEVTRALATDLMEFNSSLCANHIPGKNNIIADSLSRDFHIPKGTLIKEMYRKHGDLMPRNFKIFNLEQADISWICSITPSQRAKQVSVTRRSRSKIAHGLNGQAFLKPPTSEDAFWRTKTDLKKSASLLRSRSRLDIITLAERLKLPFEETPSELQSLKWERPSGRMDLPTPEMMPMDTSTPQSLA